METIKHIVFRGCEEFTVVGEEENLTKLSPDDLYDFLLHPLFDYRKSEFCNKEHVMQISDSNLSFAVRGDGEKLLVFVYRDDWAILDLCVHISALDNVFNAYAVASLLQILDNEAKLQDADRLHSDLRAWLTGLVYKYSEFKYSTDKTVTAFHRLASFIVPATQSSGANDNTCGLVLCGFEMV